MIVWVAASPIGCESRVMRRSLAGVVPDILPFSIIAILARCDPSGSSQPGQVMRLIPISVRPKELPFHGIARMIDQ